MAPLSPGRARSGSPQFGARSALLNNPEDIAGRPTASASAWLVRPSRRGRGGSRRVGSSLPQVPAPRGVGGPGCACRRVGIGRPASLVSPISSAAISGPSSGRHGGWHCRRSSASARPPQPGSAAAADPGGRAGRGPQVVEPAGRSVAAGQARLRARWRRCSAGPGWTQRVLAVAPTAGIAIRLGGTCAQRVVALTV